MAARSKKDDGLDALYGAPFDGFVSERDALAKRLREEGGKDRAAEIRKLRKPSRAAWAINQAVRADDAAAKELVKAGERLEAAQGGGDAEELRDAGSAHNEAVEALLEEVSDASPAVVDRVRETLRAVAGDPELRAEFEAGRVRADHRAIGFGAGVASAPARPSTPSGKAKPSAAKQRQAEQRARAAKKRADAAGKRVKQAERSLERAEKAVKASRAKLDEALADVRESEAERDEALAALDQLTGS